VSKKHQQKVVPNALSIEPRSRRHWQTADGRPHHVRAVDLPLDLAIIALGLDRFCAKFYRGDHKNIKAKANTQGRMDSLPDTLC
jgi:hypothetical protein